MSEPHQRLHVALVVTVRLGEPEAGLVGSEDAGLDMPQRSREFSLALAGLNELLENGSCLLYTSPSPRDRTRSRMPSSA